MVSLGAVVCVAVLAFATATNVEQCPGFNLANLSNSVQLTPCKKVPCALKKNTDQHITIKFTPETEIDDVLNHVQADIGGGILLPFVGVDGNSICENIFTEDDVKASCPLKANTVYVYKGTFPIEAWYPNIRVKIRWALKDAKKSEFMCFQIQAQIKN